MKRRHRLHQRHAGEEVKGEGEHGRHYGGGIEISPLDRSRLFGELYRLATSEKGTSEDNHEEPPEVLNQAFHPFMPSTLSADQTAQIAQAAQIAAIYQTYNRGRGGFRGGRGNRGGRGGRGGGNGGQQKYSASNPRWKTPRHPDSPPYGACKRHWQFGKSSFVCLEPQTCPWKQHIQPKTQN